MDKRKKIYVVVGGIWGLISGRIIFHYLRLWSFGGAIWELYFEDMLFWMIILLPAYLTHQLIFIPLLELEFSIQLPSSLSRIFFLILLLVAIIVPILSGIGISLLAANLIDKGKKVLKK